MNAWIEPFGFALAGAALVLSMMGLWFTAIIPGLDRWSKRFFRNFFLIFILCCLSGIVEVIFQSFIVPRAVFQLLLLLEDLLLSLPLPMLTAFLLHCCGESIRSSKLFHTVIGLLAIQFIIFASSAFIDGFFYVTPENQYYRGSLYPLFLLPSLAILLINLIGTIKRRKSLSRKVFLAYLVALLPVMVSLIILLFTNVFEIVDLSLALSALAMYSFILSDQIDEDRRRQQEIILQQKTIVRQQQEIAHERASVMVLRMRPHFIYNTLMSIYSLCRLDPLKARQITMDFTNYLRSNFNAIASDSTIPFSEELEHTRTYLAVEQAQFDDMLIVDYDTAFTHFRLPPLTLQPIVENAVKHGMNPNAAPLHISIRTQRKEGLLCNPSMQDFQENPARSLTGDRSNSGAEITVEDTGPGFDPSDESKPHTTLENIQQRLEMMCGGSLTICPRDGGGTVVMITIPDGTG